MLLIGAASCNSSSNPSGVFDDASVLDTSDDGSTIDAGDAERDEGTPDVAPDAGDDTGQDVEPDVVIPPNCGDGVLDDGEACDNGDDNGTGPDQCRLDCTLPFCGDGITDSAEACDDADANSDTEADACRLDCALPVCGDGVVDQGESCDDGNNNDNDACAGCEPTEDVLCTECESNDDCGISGACFAFDEEFFCLPSCADASTCPVGTTCEVTDSAGEVCFPEAATCAGCADNDGDGYGVGALCLGSDCNDGDANVNPGAADLCDGIDNDCSAETADGATDELVGVICDGDDDDLCASGLTQCVDGAVLCGESAEDIIELCDGIDNDCNPETADGSADARLGTACDGVDSDLCAEGVFGCTDAGLLCSDTTGDNVEICDLVDNDCNGLSDDNAVNATVYFADSDSDDFGDDSTEFRSCVAPDGDFVSRGGDCDDGDSAVNPSAAEVCDAQDNNCDGLVDNNALDAVAGFLDGDGDGFGDGSTFDFYCEPPDNFVTGGGDCNDEEAGVNPDATEICDDLFDNNCNFAADCEDEVCGTLPECQDFSCVAGTLDTIGARAFVGTNEGAENNVDAGCANNGTDISLQWTVPETGNYLLDTRGSDYDTVLVVTEGACNGVQLACNDDIGGGNQDSELLLSLEAGQEILIVLDAFGDGEGEVILNVSFDVPEVCDDDEDNDGDGDVDCADDECFGADVCVPDVCPDATLTGLGERIFTGTATDEEYFTTCSPTGLPDTVFAWTAEEQDEYRFSLLTDDPDGSLAFLNECGGNITCAGDDDSFGLFVFPGQTVLMVVETTGEFSINVAVDGEDCTDGEDNDLDGLVDCDDEASCGDDEACIVITCPDVDLGSVTGPAVASGSTDDANDFTDGSCANNNDTPEVAFSWTAPLAGDFEFDTIGSDYDTSLYLLDGCFGEELACDDDDGPDTLSSITRTMAEGETIIINVSGFRRNTGDYVLNITGLEVCDDGVDNTGNDLIDCADPSCSDSFGCFEVCDDGVDNDDNGLSDCADPACFGIEECDEICDDGEDNNFNDLTDCADAVCIPTEICCTPDVFEPNDGVTGQPSTILEAFVDAGSPAMTMPTGDTDSFRVNTCAGAVLTVTATHSVADGNIDIRALNSFAQLLEVAESLDDNETLVVTADQNTIFVQLYETNGDTAVCGSYELEISVDESGCAE